MSTSQEGDFLLDPQDCMMIFIDHQAHVANCVASIEPKTLSRNVVLLAKAAKIFNVPAILMSISMPSMQSELLPELLSIFPGHTPVSRSQMNAWERVSLIAEVEEIRRKKVLLAGLWTESALSVTTANALQCGYEVYIVEDACGGTSAVAHHAAIRRLERAGAICVTAIQVILEFQRDWACKETCDAVIAALREHSPAFTRAVECYQN